jgi:hypothetical protein
LRATHRARAIIDKMRHNAPPAEAPMAIMVDSDRPVSVIGATALLIVTVGSTPIPSPTHSDSLVHAHLPAIAATSRLRDDAGPVGTGPIKCDIGVEVTLTWADEFVGEGVVVVVGTVVGGVGVGTDVTGVGLGVGLGVGAGVGGEVGGGVAGGAGALGGVVGGAVVVVVVGAVPNFGVGDGVIAGVGDGVGDRVGNGVGAGVGNGVAAGDRVVVAVVVRIGVGAGDGGAVIMGNCVAAVCVEEVIDDEVVDSVVNKADTVVGPTITVLDSIFHKHPLVLRAAHSTSDKPEQLTRARRAASGRNFDTCCDVTIGRKEMLTSIAIDAIDALNILFV